MQILIVKKNDAGQRLDKFITKAVHGLPASLMYKYIRTKKIKVNRKRCEQKYILQEGDEIQLFIRGEFFDSPEKDNGALSRITPKLDIVYEDDDIIVVNKHAGMVVHPGVGNHSGTLVHALSYHLRDLEMFSEGNARAGLVHRIDKDTSGLLVVAKNEKAHAALAKQFFDHTIYRRYVALVWGNLTEDEGTIIGHIGRNPKDRMQMFVFPNGEEGKHAVTHFKVLRRYGYVTLVECRLETGRTHQIRVHMSWQGHPLFNDERYGGNRILKGTTFVKYKQFIENCFKLIPRQSLHARALGFVHPTTGEYVQFESELPDDFKAVLQKWDNYTDAVGLDLDEV